MAGGRRSAQEGKYPTQGSESMTRNKQVPAGGAAWRALPGTHSHSPLSGTLGWGQPGHCKAFNFFFYSASSLLFGGSYSICGSGVNNSQRRGEDGEKVKSAMNRSHRCFSFTASDFSRPSVATDHISSSDTYLAVPCEKLLVELEQVRISK